MGVKIEYHGKKMNQEWKERVKSSTTLTADQKKQLINQVHKEVAKHNIKEAIWFVMQFVLAIALIGLIQYLF